MTVEVHPFFRRWVVHNTNLDNIPHIDDAKILYHYRHRNGDYLPVYYELNGIFLTKVSALSYDYYHKVDSLTMDFTLVNLNLISKY